MKLCTACANVALNGDYSDFLTEDDYDFITERFDEVGHLAHVGTEADDLFRCDLCDIPGYGPVELFEKIVLSTCPPGGFVNAD